MQLPEGKKCTGCGACVNICNQKALKLSADNCGFLHPLADSTLCSDCKACTKNCPLINPPQKSNVKNVFGVRAEKDSLEENSSSGGAFSVLAEEVLKSGGVVYGAGFNENFDVCHKRIENSEDLRLIRGSKYVQSDFLAGAKDVLADLKAGKSVLFAGTPCQTAALKNMSMNAEKSRLLTVDFICHGVASPALFKKYREFISDDKKITAVSFRDKTEGWRNYSMKIEFSDGTSYRKRVVYDPYMAAYAQNISIRSSCNNCAFVGLSRVSDITLGDAWSESFKASELKNGRGVSLLMVNTEQGQKLFESVKEKLICEELESEVLHSIRPLNTPTKANPIKKYYYRDMSKLSFSKLTDKYCGASVGAKIRRFFIKKTFRWRKNFE
ncbi:MAG: Coenzyme F420 hydrogenase/dehydrogenase, beta subunit C-terminal domain [Clostridia bacterium]|nr:Coenzyme F420 hydrogenase/dehydrogenase, beta subunit C-terminal domain [Clostridia bacterium]